MTSKVIKYKLIFATWGIPAGSYFYWDKVNKKVYITINTELYIETHQEGTRNYYNLITEEMQVADDPFSIFKRIRAASVMFERELFVINL